MQSEDKGMDIIREVFNEIVKQTLSENLSAPDEERRTNWMSYCIFLRA